MLRLPTDTLATLIAIALVAVPYTAAAQTPSAVADPGSPTHADPTFDRGAPDGPDVLLGPGDRLTFTGFGGMDVRYSRMLDRDAAFVCVEGGMILDHALSIGIAGCGLANEVDAADATGRPYADGRIDLGYGGAAIRYHFMAKEMVNLSVGAIVGAGTISFDDGAQDDDEYTDGVFVFEPQVGVHLNVTRWMRLAATGGYRVVRGVETDNMDDGALSNLAVGGNVQFGWF